VLGHNRIEEVRAVIAAITPQVDRVWVHDNASDPPLHTVLKEEFPDAVFLWDGEQPPNLSRYWNVTLDQVDLYHFSLNALNQGKNPPEYKVAVLTDDVEIPEDWFDSVAQSMDRTGAAAGCVTAHPGRLTTEVLKTFPDSDIINRLYGPAFILRGEAQIRADERLRWWFGDTDVDWRARKQGGMVIIPGPYAHNRYPNQSTVGVNAEQAGRDRETFKEIWGWVPW
jgi:GT2 family glycosyltransferase